MIGYISSSRKWAETANFIAILSTVVTKTQYSDVASPRELDELHQGAAVVPDSTPSQALGVEIVETEDIATSKHATQEAEETLGTEVQ